ANQSGTASIHLEFTTRPKVIRKSTRPSFTKRGGLSGQFWIRQREVRQREVRQDGVEMPLLRHSRRLFGTTEESLGYATLCVFDRVFPPHPDPLNQGEGTAGI